MSGTDKQQLLNQSSDVLHDDIQNKCISGDQSVTCRASQGEVSQFSDFPLSNSTMTAIRKKGYEEPTPIQAAVIPRLLSSNKSLLGQAQTGTGKTAAYSIPIVEKVDITNLQIQTLVLAPTRELALQISTEMNSFRGSRRVSILPIYGGQSFSEQLTRLQRGAQVIIGTPGRILDHLYRGTISFEGVKTVVLDEADEMLSMGFIDDIDKILSFIGKSRQMLLFSATVPEEIRTIVVRYMGDYEHIVIKAKQLSNDLVEQTYFEVSLSNRVEALCRIIDMNDRFYGIVFCNTKMETDAVASELIKRGFRSECLHGDSSQAKREKILNQFKNHEINILVSTDVAARGIDVNDLTHVINYSLPSNPEAYIHRVGRTGRAGKKGQAITFISSDEGRKLSSIGQSINTAIVRKNLPSIKELVETKINRIKGSLHAILETDNFESYKKLAGELLHENDHVSLVAAMLRFSFQDQFEESHYDDLSEDVGSSEFTNLFFGRGSNHSMSQGKILDTLVRDTGVSRELFRSIKILPDFSFFMVASDKAQALLNHYQRLSMQTGERPPLVRPAFRKQDRRN